MSRKIKCLCIYPRIPPTFWSFRYALKFINKKAAFPPLGLLTIASFLPDEWEKRFVDMNITEFDLSDLKWADVLLISGMEIQKKEVLKILKYSKDNNICVIAGGPLFSNEPEKYMSLTSSIVIGEAEGVINKVICDFSSGKLEPVYKDNGFPSLDNIPPPLWNIAEIEKYASLCIQISRGCPYNCDFCNVTSLFGRRVRIKPVERVIMELDVIKSYNWKGDVFFVDDNFVANHRYVKESLLPTIIEWQKKNNFLFKFHTQASMDLADDNELLDLMVEANFDKVFIGIETPEEESLKECNKRHNTGRNLLNDVRKIQQKGIQVQGGFIVGFDRDNSTIFNRQIDFIEKAAIVTAMVGILQAIPGTGLFNRLKAESRIDGELTGDNVDVETNIIPSMNIDVLKQGYRRMMKYLYQHQNFYKRCRDFVRMYKSKIHSIRGISLAEWKAFWKIIWTLGIKEKGRISFWYTFLWTLFFKPYVLPQIITLSVFGYHFRKLIDTKILVSDNLKKEEKYVGG